MSNKTQYSEEDAQMIVTSSDKLKIMEKTEGWKYLKELIELDTKKNVDILVSSVNLKPDEISNLRGKIQYANSIFDRMALIHNKANKVKEI